MSEFINPETGHLVATNKETDCVIQEARKIISPGSNGDPWWDCEQLIKQMETAIDVFKEAHPGKQGLWIFDNSSAHASLAPDALRAFDMNRWWEAVQAEGYCHS